MATKYQWKGKSGMTVPENKDELMTVILAELLLTAQDVVLGILHNLQCLTKQVPNNFKCM